MLEEIGRHNIIIDFSNLNTISSTTIYYKHGELNTSSIKAKLVDRRKTIDLTSCRVVVNIINEKGERIVDDAEVLDVKEGIILIKFQQVALDKGISFFELLLVENGEMTKKSPKIAYRVLDSLSEDAIIESEKYPILVNLIKEVEDLHVTSENLINETRVLKQEVIDLNATMTQAESVRNSNEETRKSNEVTRQGNETSRISNMERINNEFAENIASNNKKIDDKIVDIQTQLDTKTSQKFVEVDNTVGEKMRDVQTQVDAKFVEVDSGLANKLESAQTQVDEKMTLVDNKVASFDGKMNEIDSTISQLNTFKDDTTLKVNTKVEELDTSMTSIENRFNALSPEQSTNAEVQLARTSISGVTYESLKERLDVIEQNPFELWETIEG